MKRLSVLIVVVGAAWLIAFAALQFTPLTLALGVVYVVAVAFTFALPGRLAPKLAGSYAAAALVVWVMLIGPQFATSGPNAGWAHPLGLLICLLWGGFIWGGLLAVPFMVETMLPRRRPA